MRYRKDKSGAELSQLGFGCMRFTKKAESFDYDKAEAEVLRSIELGVNYFDTAYIYSGNEVLMGKIFARNHLREQVYIATKLPQYLMRSIAQVEKTFNEQLERLQTDYIDYYLMHMFTDIAEWEHLRSLDIERWIAEKKASGAIRNIGFSYHGDSEMFRRVLDVYDWDFCQIQYNYLDELSQAGRRGLEAAYAKGIPVIIMEPLRGGKLVNLPAEAQRMVDQDKHGYSAAELGLRWLWNQPGVTCVLSGMNSLAMVEENARLADECAVGCLDEEGMALVDQVKAIIRKREQVGCTGCRYCMPCPAGVDIPGNFHYYNLMYLEGKNEGRWRFFQNMGLRKDPGFASQCVGCGKCEKHCPQHLSIRKELVEADKALRPLPNKLAIEVARRLVTRG